MSNIFIVKASLKLFTEEQGGRNHPLLREHIYRPNHVIVEVNRIYGRQGTWIGQIELHEVDKLYPGEEAIIIVKFLNDDILEKLIKVGLTWKIYEFPKIIGIARVVEIVGTSDLL